MHLWTTSWTQATQQLWTKLLAFAVTVLVKLMYGKRRGLSFQRQNTWSPKIQEGVEQSVKRHMIYKASFQSNSFHVWIFYSIRTVATLNFWSLSFNPCNIHIELLKSTSEWQHTSRKQIFQILPVRVQLESYHHCWHCINSNITVHGICKSGTIANIVWVLCLFNDAEKWSGLESGIILTYSPSAVSSMLLL